MIVVVSYVLVNGSVVGSSEVNFKWFQNITNIYCIIDKVRLFDNQILRKSRKPSSVDVGTNVVTVTNDVRPSVVVISAFFEFHKNSLLATKLAIKLVR